VSKKELYGDRGAMGFGDIILKKYLLKHCSLKVIKLISMGIAYYDLRVMIYVVVDYGMLGSYRNRPTKAEENVPLTKPFKDEGL